MKKSFIFVLFLCFIGCTSTKGTLEENSKKNSNQSVEKILAEENKKRIKFLKTIMPSYGYNPELLVEINSLFDLMKIIQNGEITSDSVKGFTFYLKDPVGIDNGIFNLSKYFQCAQVIPISGVKNSDQKEVEVYKALYFNPIINITIVVYWYNSRPLVGQKLNVDFLAYLGVNEYKTNNNEMRSQIEFIRPAWAY